jgi:glycerophosphoryl diester phosphodiesterase
VYQARVSYSTIVKNTVEFLNEIKHPQAPVGYIEQKLEDLVKQCGNNPQNWIFYMSILS